MRERLSVREMFALSGMTVECDSPFPAHVASDNRDVLPGSAFVALEGERTDGHRYIGDAVERGASLVIGRIGKSPESLSVPYIGLEEPERDLGLLAARYVKRVAPREIVAVTGSVGKTTTREAIGRVLQGRYRLHAATRSFNTVIGCSMTVLAMPLNAELLLLEFGANSSGEIRALARLFPPTAALITQVAPVHLEGFGSLTGVLRAKMEIVESPNLRNFFYDGDNPLLREAVLALPPSVRTWGVGRERGEYRVENTSFQIQENLPVLSFDLAGPKSALSFSSGVWGQKLAMPLAMAAAVGEAFGVPLEEAALALRSFSGLKGRGRVLFLPSPEGRSRFLVDDAYNANPISMRSSLETFISLKTEGPKVAVLGDMKELGENEVRYHKDLADLVERLDGAVFVGTVWKEALKNSPQSFSAKWHFVESGEAAAEIVEKTVTWEGLLVKGSNSLRLGDRVVARIAKESERLV